jgi:hypothetical protein
VDKRHAFFFFTKWVSFVVHNPSSCVNNAEGSTLGVQGGGRGQSSPQTFIINSNPICGKGPRDTGCAGGIYHYNAEQKSTCGVSRLKSQHNLSNGRAPNAIDRGETSCTHTACNFCEVPPWPGPHVGLSYTSHCFWITSGWNSSVCKVISYETGDFGSIPRRGRNFILNMKSISPVSHEDSLIQWGFLQWGGGWNGVKLISDLYLIHK